MRVVIHSRFRQETIGKLSLSIFPDAYVCVEDKEVEAYSAVVRQDHIIPHPPARSLAEIRNWIIRNTPDDAFFMPDDDLTGVVSMVGRNAKKFSDPADVMQIVENAAFIAKQIGAGYFGFCQSGRPYAFSVTDPIGFAGWVGTAIGIIGKDIFYDERLSLHDDYDFSLQQLLHKRIIYRDTRFFFESAKRLRLQGGNTAWRSSEREANEMAYLTEKWGRFVWYYQAAHSASGKTQRNRTFSIAANVRRRQ